MVIFVLPPLAAPFFSHGETVMEFTGFSWWSAACLLLAVLLNFILGEFPGEVFRGFFFKVKETAATNGNCNADGNVESDGNCETNENCNVDENYEANGNCEADKNVEPNENTEANGNVEANGNYEVEGNCEANETVETNENSKVDGTAERGNLRGFSAETNSTESESFCTRLFTFLYRGILFVFIPGAGTFRRVIVIAEFLKTFGILFAVQAFFALVEFALKLPPRAAVHFPDGVTGFFSCAAVFLAAAFYEETLYRAYLPFSLKRILRAESRQHPQAELSHADVKTATETDSEQQDGTRARFFDAGAEIASIAIFGFSHFNNGALSAANALVAGFFLRRCAVRTGGIKAGLFAHFLYNALTLAIVYAVTAH